MAAVTICSARRDWGQEEKGTTEDEMAGGRHWLDGRESGWTPGVGDGQGGLVCCDSWGHKESDTTERLNWTECFPNLSITGKFAKNTKRNLHTVEKLKIELPHATAIPFLGINPEKTIIQNTRCTPTFISVKTWQQSKWLWIEEWIKKMWYTYTMEYYSVVKRI